MLLTAHCKKGLSKLKTVLFRIWVAIMSVPQKSILSTVVDYYILHLVYSSAEHTLLPEKLFISVKVGNWVN